MLKIVRRKFRKKKEKKNRKRKEKEKGVPKSRKGKGSKILTARTSAGMNYFLYF